MRKILFRGKMTKADAWVYGSLFIDDKKVKHEICYGYVNFRIAKEVDPKTVGQYTGFVDGNGRKIFEGDILASQYDDPPEGPAIEVVVWHNGAWCQKQGHHDPEPIEYDNFFLKTSNVIGNIHDNPELLEGGGH